MLKQLLWQRNGGYWLFWVSALYLTAGMIDIFVVKFSPTEIIQLVWLLAIAMPFYFPPLGRWLNLNVTWDQKMFNWFGKKNKTPSNVVPFPEKKETKNDYMPPVPPEKKTTGQSMYSIGLTDENRVSLRMGYSEITMNPQGVQNLIDQLELFKQQIMDVDQSEDNDTNE